MSYIPGNQSQTPFDRDALAAQFDKYRQAAVESQKAKYAPRNQVDPDFLTKMIGTLFGRHQAALLPQMQSVINAMRSNAGRTGMSGFGVFKQAKAGVPGVFAAEAGKRAAGQAIDVYGQRAAIQGQQTNLPNAYDQFYTAAKYGTDVLGSYFAQGGGGGDASTFDPFPIRKVE